MCVHVCVCERGGGGGVIFNGLSPYYFLSGWDVFAFGGIDIIMMRIWWRLKMKIELFSRLQSPTKPLCSLHCQKYPTELCC